MNRTGFLYDDVYLSHRNPPYHPEHSGRVKHIRDVVESSPLASKLIRIKPRKAKVEEVLEVHTRKHLEFLKEGQPGYLGPDTYLSKGTFKASLWAAGALLRAVDGVKSGEIERAFCAVRPPGHHAERDRAMGFCFFNNIAVAARYARKRGFQKIFIVDFDVHHGNGTQRIFEEDPAVFYFSTHQYPFYPGTGRENEKGRGVGEGYTMNLPLPAGSGDEVYERIYTEFLPGLINSFEPSIILVSAGYDIHIDDPIGGMTVTTEGVRKIVRGILKAAGNKTAVIFTLEGGYNLDALGDSVLVTLEEMIR
ncbi:MAG: histone deacetylase [Spirochaetales bacterium]|nr:histone deacetylase [Spirochaetales bacterium]